jgi:sugar lactone lactonase YvrE
MGYRYLAGLTLAIAGCAMSQTYTMRTFAGGALPENLAGVSASLGEIYGLAIDSAGNVFLSLGDYSVVVRLDAGTGVLTRVAGTGTPGYSGDGGPAASAQLSGPTGIAVDSAGNLYIADSGNFRVRMVSAGVITTVAGNGTPGYSGDGGPAKNAQFSGLSDIAVDRSGNLYIADLYSHVVRKVSNGAVTTAAGIGSYGYSGDNGPATNAELAGPSGIAVDSAGALYIAEGYNNRVRKVVNGTITTAAGNGAASFSGDRAAAVNATLRQPADVAVDAAGNLYIADFGNNRIRMVASSGVINTVAGNGTQSFSGDRGAPTSAGLASPRRLALDASGNLHIADGVRIRRVAGAAINTVAGGGPCAGESGPPATAQLHSPRGLAVDQSGNVYITDAGTGRILKAANGAISKVAGTGNAGFTGDNGPAASAQLSAPNGIAVDGSGDIYIADSLNARIRRISQGVITTVAGGGSAFGDNGQATNARLTNPQGIAVDSAGNLYVADLNRVRAIVNGVIRTAAGNGGLGYQGDNGPATAAYLASPWGVATDTSGNFFIADTGNNRIRKVFNGVITTVAGNGTYGFTGVAALPPL